MSDINPLNSASYFAGVQNAASEAAKNEKKEKVSSTKVKFSQFIEKQEVQKENNIICIAITKIFSTGINIKNLHNIILAAGGKSSVTVVQSIGRGLRLHPDKKELNIFDICDKGFKYSTAHGDKRLKIYAKEKIKVESADIILRT